MQTTFNCKICGAPLNVVDGGRICKCEYCDTKQTIPLLDSDKKRALFSRANKLRLENEFDKASNVFETLVSEFPTEAEAYWGLILCNYGIEYVDDPFSGKKVPTCHRTVPSSIFEEKDFQNVMTYADDVAVELYKNEARQIDTLQNSILDIAKKEKPYDVFICYKETDENGNRTKDSVLAQDIYDKLAEKGYKVFFSRITLEDKLGQEYEPYIYSALNSAKVMIVVGTNEKYLNSVWVKNEWSRFLSFMKNDKNKTIIPCYSEITAYDLPIEFRSFQGAELSKIGAVQDVVRAVEKLISKKKEFNNEQIEDIINKTTKEQKKNNKRILFVVLAIAIAIGACLYYYISMSNQKLTNIVQSAQSNSSAKLTPASEVDMDTINVNIDYIDDYPVTCYTSENKQAKISIGSISHEFIGIYDEGKYKSAQYTFTLNYDVLETAKGSNNDTLSGNVLTYIQIYEDDTLLDEMNIVVANTKGKGKTTFNFGFILKENERNIFIKVKSSEPKEEKKSQYYMQDFILKVKSLSSDGTLSLNVTNNSKNNLYHLCFNVFVYDSNNNNIGMSSGDYKNFSFASNPVQPNKSYSFTANISSLTNDYGEYIFKDHELKNSKIIFEFIGYAIDDQNLIEFDSPVEVRVN